MNWDAIGAVAELLGAIGVIGSLAYVATQVRASVIASKVESKLRMTEQMVNYADLLIADPQLQKLMIAGRRDYDALSKDDQLLFSNLALKACWYLSSGFFMHQHDSITDDDWFELKSIAVYWASSPGFQQWWRKRGNQSFAGPFIQFIEQEIEAANALAGAEPTPA